MEIEFWMSRLSSPFQRMLPKRLEGTAGKIGIATAAEVSCTGRLVGGSLEGGAAAALWECSAAGEDSHVCLDSCQFCSLVALWMNCVPWPTVWFAENSIWFESDFSDTVSDVLLHSNTISLACRRASATQVQSYSLRFNWVCINVHAEGMNSELLKLLRKGFQQQL